MRTFPDDEAIERLTALGVRYVIVHQAYYAPDEYADLMERVGIPRANRSASAVC